SLSAAVAELLQTPALWPRALVPVVVFSVLLVACAGFGLLVARPWVETLFPDPMTTLGEIGVEAAGYGTAFIVVLAGWFVSFALARPLSAPALESLVGAIDARVGAPPRAPLGFVSELACGFRALFGAVLVALPAFFVIWL